MKNGMCVHLYACVGICVVVSGVCMRNVFYASVHMCIHLYMHRPVKSTG